MAQSFIHETNWFLRNGWTLNISKRPVTGEYVVSATTLSLGGGFIVRRKTGKCWKRTLNGLGKEIRYKEKQS